MKENDVSVQFLYGTTLGRLILKILMSFHIDKLIVGFLKSKLSYPLISKYVKKYNIDIQGQSFKTYQEFFLRSRNDVHIDLHPEHLISPCDGFLSCFSLDETHHFFIKGSYYDLKDFIQDDILCEQYKSGTLLVFRLCARDYHHYCYIDEGYQNKHKEIKGTLHSVQSIACETYPVYTLNKRTVSVLNTKHFKDVIQCEIGAFVVGGIVNKKEDSYFKKGEEKGYFDLAGSTIVLIFKKDSICLKECYNEQEIRVQMGEWIGSSKKI